MRGERQESIRNGMKRSKQNGRSRALWMWVSALFLAASALGFHFLTIQTAGAAAVQGGAGSEPQRRVPDNRELVDALVVVNRILASEQYGILDTSGHVS